MPLGLSTGVSTTPPLGPLDRPEAVGQDLVDVSLVPGVPPDQSRVPQPLYGLLDDPAQQDVQSPGRVFELGYLLHRLPPIASTIMSMAKIPAPPTSQLLLSPGT